MILPIFTVILIHPYGLVGTIQKFTEACGRLGKTKRDRGKM